MRTQVSTFHDQASGVCLEAAYAAQSLPPPPVPLCVANQENTNCGFYLN